MLFGACSNEIILQASRATHHQFPYSPLNQLSLAILSHALLVSSFYIIMFLKACYLYARTSWSCKCYACVYVSNNLSIVSLKVERASMACQKHNLFDLVLLMYYIGEIVIWFGNTFDLLAKSHHTLLFQCGDRLYTTESDVYSRQILTFKVDLRTKRVKYF